MKKILSFLNLVILGALLTVSCNLNENPKFDDKDAFVAFDNATMTVSESVGTIKVPVTLASVKGIAATISFQAVDGTAKGGINYELLDGAGTLTFTAEERTQYITVKINKITGYTGDLKFTLKFKEGGLAGLSEGAENKCVITITDNDHPLGDILGTYTAAGVAYPSTATSWKITLAKDASDVTVVWFIGITPYFEGGGSWGYPAYDTRFYGNVTMKAGKPSKITIPFNQTCAYKYQGTNEIFLWGLNASLNYVKSGNVEAAISANFKTITLDATMGLATVDATGYWDAILPGIVWTK